jgi:hypothetical protein
MTSKFSLDLSIGDHKNRAMRIRKIVVMGGKLVFLASANTTAGETVPL